MARCHVHVQIRCGCGMRQHHPLSMQALQYPLLIVVQCRIDIEAKMLHYLPERTDCLLGGISSPCISIGLLLRASMMALAAVIAACGSQST